MTTDILRSQTYPQMVSLMEEALASPKGIRLHFDLWTAAVAFRNQLGKARKKANTLWTEMSGIQPGDPGFGQSHFSELHFAVEPDISDLSLETTFLWLPAEKSKSRTSLLSALARHAGKLQLSERDLLRPLHHGPLSSLLSLCSVKAVRTMPSGPPMVIFVERAPTFAFAWGAIVKVLPAWLYIRNSPEEQASSAFELL